MFLDAIHSLSQSSCVTLWILTRSVIYKCILTGIKLCQLKQNWNHLYRFTGTQFTTWAQLVINFPTVYKSWNLTTFFPAAWHSFLSSFTLIQLKTSQFIHLKTILLLSPYLPNLPISLSNSLFKALCLTKTLCVFFVSLMQAAVSQAVHTPKH
jgi:hypothetical protein